MFATYLELGFDHILDLQGYDHIAFVIALCAAFNPQAWKRLLWLITAFTLGHSITLAMAALQIYAPPREIIEFIIPITILLTAISNMYFIRQPNPKFSIGMATIFGFIHGWGFSNYFRETSLGGDTWEVVLQLLAFNLGVELGQIVIIGLFLLLTSFVISVLRWSLPNWQIFASGIAAGIAITLIL